MAGKSSPQNVIDNYRKRQRKMPFILGGLAVLLVVVGIIILVVWLTSPGNSISSLFATATPTATSTSTSTPVTPTLTSTVTPTETLTPTITETSTPSGPFEYTILENDNCWDIAAKFKVDVQVLQGINNFGTECPIVAGQVILIPAPGQTLPTETPLPTGLAAGTKIEYTIKTGETLAIIASRFNTTVESIMKDNDIEDENTILAGQIITIRVNLVTPTITLAPSSTRSATVLPAASATATP
ncbi:MAG: LysM peptidoglycan-binding domain-containing protein [Chloroflexi bacterium]|nr:LysM peptidoglycan-binding domain-containing protein [Chloroflexota bacterium]